MRPERLIECSGICTHAEFETKLNEMAHFFAAEKRMSLWKSLGNNKHEWVERPEARAQDTVTAYLLPRTLVDGRARGLVDGHHAGRAVARGA